MDLERLEPLFIEPEDSIQVTVAEDWYTLTRDSEAGHIDQLLMLVWYEGEKRILSQYRGEPLVDLLVEDDILEVGREIWLERPDEDNWKVAWIGEDGTRNELST